MPERDPSSAASLLPPAADLSGLPTVSGVGPAAGRPIPVVRAGRLGRAFDLLVASVVLVLTAPIVAIAALAVTRESKGGALFRQGRIGLRGQPFEVLKLRTMVQGAEQLGAGLAVEAGDARITRVGAFLRRTSIDELPNLVNVLRGEMAIVGPRPTVASQVERYTERELGRLAVRPRDHGPRPGLRPRFAPLGRAHRDRPPLHPAPLLPGRPPHPGPHGADRLRRRRPVPRRDGRLAVADRLRVAGNGRRLPIATRTFSQAHDRVNLFTARRTVTTWRRGRGRLLKHDAERHGSSARQLVPAGLAK